MEQKTNFFCSKGVLSRRGRILAMMEKNDIYYIVDLAKKVGTSRPTMSAIINGHIRPSQSQMLRIAQILKCDSRIIFPEEENIEIEKKEEKNEGEASN
jgi:transcriptional regulator with XRE-family HTH domain